MKVNDVKQIVWLWSGVGGAVFEGSIQTPLVRAESGSDLRYIQIKIHQYEI